MKEFLLFKGKDLITFNFYRCNRPFGTVIISPGVFLSKDWGFIPYVSEILSKSFNVVAINFSLNGYSNPDKVFNEEQFSINTISNEIKDLDYILDFLQEEVLNPEEINMPFYMIGHSRGAATNIIFASERLDISALVCWNPTLYVNTFDDESVKRIKEEGFIKIFNQWEERKVKVNRNIIDDIEANRERFNVFSKIKDLRIPTLILQGEQDHPFLLSKVKEVKSIHNEYASYVFLYSSNHYYNNLFPFAEPSKDFTFVINETVNYLLRRAREDNENTNCR